MTRIFDAEETAARLPYPDLADSIRDVALARSSGTVGAPPRLALPLPNRAVLLVMPAADAEIAITKLVTVHPENSDLPTIQGEVVVMEASTGRRLGILDGATVTARRTAALSLLAARELAPRPEGPLLVVGAGAQARSHLEAFREGLGVSKIFVSSRTPERAEALAAHAKSLGMEAAAVATPGEALADARLVVTATTSPEPVLPDAVAEGTFVAAVGSFQPEAAELPPGLVSGAVVVVDTMGGGGRRGWGPDPGRKSRRFPVVRRRGTRGRLARAGTPAGHGNLQERGAFLVGPRRREDGLPAIDGRTPDPGPRPGIIHRR